MFTDDDFKRLKESIKPNTVYISFKGDTIRYLLNRLEAAERYAWSMDRINGAIGVKYMDSARKAWRKVAGK